MDGFFKEQGKDDVKSVLKKLDEMTECDISVYISDMVKNLIKLAENGWMDQPKAPTTSSIKNPYQNNENLAGNAAFYDNNSYNYSGAAIQDMYVFSPKLD